MNIVAVDFETYFDDEYSLKKLTTEAYIRSPKFKVLGCAFFDGEKSFWVEHDKILYALCHYKDYAFVCHHAQFDGLILSHHYNFRPARWLDTLSMARYVHGNSISVSLDSLSTFYNFKPKTVPYDLFKGKEWHELDDSAKKAVSYGAIDDCKITYQLFNELSKQFPQCEYPIIDITIRMFTEPVLQADQGLLQEIALTEAKDKAKQLDTLGVTAKQLGSNEEFIKLLEAEGVDIQYKEGKNGPIPAFAKTDNFMQSLQENQDTRVSALANARLSIKSSIVETRANRFYDMSTRGALAVYLYYSGAHTRRWSGGDSTNFQNINRGSSLRKAIRAPQGFLLAKPDQAQGECRILNWFAGQSDVVDKFRRGEDPYIGIASKFYGFEVTRDHPKERGVGKQLELSCGYGSGSEKIVITAARGTYGPPVYLSAEEGIRARDLYRSEHRNVVDVWRTADSVISWLYGRKSFNWNILTGENGRLFHPNGNWLDYTGLQWDKETKQWKLASRHGYVKMYGSKLIENIIQWLSRIVTSEAMLVFKAHNYPIVGMSHDDIWLLIPKEHGIEDHRTFIEATMSATPSWAPGLPLDSQCDIGETYK